MVGEILEAIKGKVGPDFPIMIKLSAHDFVKGGLEPPEALEIARRLEQDGIAAIQVSACCTVSNKDQHCPKDQILDLQDEAYLMDFTQFIKEGVKVPVIAVGGIRSYLHRGRNRETGKGWIMFPWDAPLSGNQI